MFLEDQGFFGLWLMFSKDQMFWILAQVIRGLRFFGSWLMFSEDQGFFGALALVFRGLKVLDPGLCFQRTRILGLVSCFQRTNGSGSWLMFSET